MLDLLLRVLVVAFGMGVTVVFTRLARRVKAAPLNGISNREPLLWAVAWFGAVIAVLWAVMPLLPFDISKPLSRVGVIAAAAPPCHQAWRLHREWW
jgi:hypothetical protein